jgi:hypothetical protein
MTRLGKTKLFFYITLASGAGSWLSVRMYRQETNRMLGCVDTGGGILSAPSSCFDNNVRFWDSAAAWLMWIAIIAGLLTVVLFMSWLITVGEKSHEAS